MKRFIEFEKIEASGRGEQILKKNDITCECKRYNAN
jgi:hypothetical protein